MQPSTNPSGVIDDDPLSPAYGRLPAFDQLANGQTVQRANRIPRVAPRRPGLFRRLHTAVKRLHLEWLLHDLGNQLDAIEELLIKAGQEAALTARSHRYSPLHNARRRDLRRQYARVAERMLSVRRELDNLSAAA